MWAASRHFGLCGEAKREASRRSKSPSPPRVFRYGRAFLATLGQRVTQRPSASRDPGGHRVQLDARRRAHHPRRSARLGGSVHDPTGRLLFAVLSMIAEFEADLTRARTREGTTKAKGRVRGERPKLKPAQEKHLAQLWNDGIHATAELADLFTGGPLQGLPRDPTQRN